MKKSEENDGDDTSADDENNYSGAKMKELGNLRSLHWKAYVNGEVDPVNKAHQ